MASYVPGIYGNDIPTGKPDPPDGKAPGLVPRLCNRIESCILLYYFPLFRLVSGNLGRWVWSLTLRIYKVFTKTGQGPWLGGDSALGPLV